MKKILLIIIVTTLNLNVFAQFKFLIDFDSANIDTLKSKYNSKTNTIEYYPFKDNTNTENVWFYFGATGYRNDTALTILTKFDKEIIIPNYPTISFNNIDFQNIKMCKHNNIAKVCIQKPQDSIFISLGYPYNYKKLTNYIKTLKNNKLVQIDNSFQSKQKLSVPYLTITDFTIKTKKKKTIWIIGRQHAFESISNYTIEGMINYLISNEAQNDKILQKYIFRIIPIVDVDNVYNGQTGRMSKPRDLNRDWDKPLNKTIQWIENLIKSTTKKSTYYAFFDIHSTYPGGKSSYFFSYFDIYSKNPYTENMMDYWHKFHKYTGFRPKIIIDTDEYYDSKSSDLYNALYFKPKYFSTTIECDWNLNFYEKVWNTEDWKNIGKFMMKSLL